MLFISATIAAIPLVLEERKKKISVLERSSMLWFRANNNWSYLENFTFNEYHPDDKFKQIGSKTFILNRRTFLWMLMTFSGEKSLLPLPPVHCLHLRGICWESILLNYEENQKGISAQKMDML